MLDCICIYVHVMYNSHTHGLSRPPMFSVPCCALRKGTPAVERHLCMLQVGQPFPSAPMRY